MKPDDQHTPDHPGTPECSEQLEIPPSPTGQEPQPPQQKGRIYPRDSFVPLEDPNVHYVMHRFLVPSDVNDELAREREARSQMRMARLLNRDKKVKESEDDGGSDSASGGATDQEPDNGASPASEDNKPNADANADAEHRRSERGKVLQPGPAPVAHTLAQILEFAPARERWKVIDAEAVEALGAKGSSTDTDVRERNMHLHKKLMPMGEYRRVSKLPKAQALNRLRQSHPHFEIVIDFVADRLALAARSRQPVRIPPILLSGPPGIGKTHFCDALAKVLGVPCRRHQMDQAESSSALLGSEKTWSNSRMGLVFEEIVLGEYANPIIILDELDKAPRRGNHSSPSAVLHTLLEPVSANRVRDISVDIEFDASLITWVATCNYPWQIAPTLLSRMKCFWIDMPDARQALLMAKSVAEQAVKDAAVPGFQVPGREILVEIAHYSARQVYQIVSEAVAKCVKDKRRAIEVADIAQWTVREEGDNTPNVVLH